MTQLPTLPSCIGCFLLQSSFLDLELAPAAVKNPTHHHSLPKAPDSTPVLWPDPATAGRNKEDAPGDEEWADGVWDCAEEEVQNHEQRAAPSPLWEEEQRDTNISEGLMLFFSPHITKITCHKRFFPHNRHCGSCTPSGMLERTTELGLPSWPEFPILLQI